MNRLKKPSQADIELFNRSKRDVICFAAKEIGLFLCCVALFPGITPWLRWTCVGFGAASAIFYVVWDALITLGKVKPTQARFLWLIFSLQGLSITVLFLVRTRNAFLVLSILAIQVASLVISIITSRKP